MRENTSTYLQWKFFTQNDGKHKGPMGKRRRLGIGVNMYYHNYTWSLQKKPESQPSLNYLSPLGRSDHITIQINIHEEETIRYNKDNKKARMKFANAKFPKLNKFYKEINCRNSFKHRQVYRKYMRCF